MIYHMHLYATLDSSC